MFSKTAGQPEEKSDIAPVARSADFCEGAFTVGVWTIEPSLNRLSQGDQEVIVGPTVMNLILCLVQSHNQPVSRDVLFERLWPGQIVSDNSLYQAVAQLRKAFGDTDKQKRYVARVSGKGYRLIAPVATIQTERPASKPSLNRSKRKIILFVAALAALGCSILVFTVGFFGFSSEKKALSQSQLKSVFTVDAARVDFALMESWVDSASSVSDPGQGWLQGAQTPLFEDYQLARHLWREYRPEPLQKAKQMFESLSVRVDDRHPLRPWILIAQCEVDIALYEMSDRPLEKVLSVCHPILDRVFMLQPDFQPAQTARALLLSLEGRGAEAEQVLAAAVQVRPDDVPGRLFYSELLRRRGKYQASLKQNLHAYQLAPTSGAVNRGLAFAYLNLQQMDKAQYYYRRASVLEPNYVHRAVTNLDFYPAILGGTTKPREYKASS